MGIYLFCFKIRIRVRKQSTDRDYLLQLDLSLSKIPKNAAVWLLGDFNLPSVDWDTMSFKTGGSYPAISNLMIDIANDFILHQIVKEPTRESNILDLCFTNSPARVDSVHVDSGISDHDVVIVNALFKPKVFRPPKRKVFLYHKANFSNIDNDMEELNSKLTPKLISSSSMDELYELFMTTLFNSIDKNIPAKLSSSRFSYPWVNRLIKRDIKRKQRLYDKVKKYENVQRRAARFIFNNYSRQSSVSEMLKDLKWDSLETRRFRARLVVMYKETHGLLPSNVRNHLIDPSNLNRRTTRRTSGRKSLNPEIASVQPLDPKAGRSCSSKAVVTAVSTHPSQKTTVVYAEEEGSGLSLRCDVIVAKIVFIDIVTTTRILYLGDSPEEFEVRALDDKGNTFSSLEGLEFEWSLLSDDTAHTVIDAKSILKFVTFQESKYTALPHIAKFELKDRQGDRILIEGLKAGSAKVEARLNADVFRDVKPSVVRLIVIDHLMLNPSQEIYILPHCQVPFYVEKLRQGKVTVLPMPSNQYSLQVANESVATMDPQTSILTGVTLGDTNVTLRDNNIREGFSLPSTGVHVIEPKYLGFVIFPGKNWVLQTNSWYEILIEVYDRDSNKMFPANIPNIRIETLFPNSYFEVKQSTVNGSHHYVRTKMSGVTEIEASLVSIVKPDGEKVFFDIPIKETQEVEIYDPVTVIPEYLGFPWLPTGNSQYSYRLKASGGTGTYIWSSSHLPVATVNVQGTVTTAKEQGATQITAADSRNPSHYGTSMVYVQSPASMQFIDSQVEALVGEELHLPLAMFGEVLENGKRVKISLTDCSMVPLKRSVVDESIFEMTETKEDIEVAPGACTLIHVRALNPGHTQVRVVLDQVKPPVEAVVTIAAYKELVALDPESVAIVTPGSSKTVIFTGGPQPWVLDPTHYFETLSGEREDYISVKHLKSSRASRGKHVFQVICLRKGEQVLTAKVGNGPSARNKYPAVAKAILHFRCSNPVSLQLIPLLVRPDEQEEPCPVPLDANGQIPVMNNNDIEFEVRAVDGQGNFFDNSSSLIVKWSSTNNNLATFDYPILTYSDFDGEIAGSRVVRAIQVCSLTNREGPVTLTATSTSYDSGLFHSHGMKISPKIDMLSASVDLILVSEARIEPTNLSIFNHPSNKAELKLLGGSSHFMLKTEPRGLAEVTYIEKKKTIRVIPHHDGRLTITAYDLCLATTQHATAKVHMAGVHNIELTVVDRVQIEHDITAEVRVLDSIGQPLSVSYFPLMNLQPNIESEIIEVKPDQTRIQDQYSAYYTVHGAVLGFTNLAFTATSKTGQVVSSKVRDIQVFPPLQLSPRNVTLIVGQQFQIRSLGGPQPLSEVEYSIEDDHIASVSGSGMIDALVVGHTVVTGTAIGYDPEIGSDVNYSKDIVNVFVIELSGIKIHAPLHRLETGTLMPAYAMGTNDQETPFTIGAAKPGLQFFWTSSNSDVIQVEPVYLEDGVEPTPENQVAIRIRTINPGEATLRLQVTVSPKSRHQVVRNGLLTDEIRIEVFEKLVMFEKCECRLLMAPETQAAIKTNRDGSAVMTYQVLSSPGSEQIVTVNSQGVVTSGSRTGKAVVEVVARESFRSNQTMLALVQVKPVSYIAVEPATHLGTDSSHHLEVYPVGLPLAFTVGFYDNIGEKFDATNMRVAHRLHRFDFLQLQAGPENATFSARAAHHGSTIFRIWDEDNPRTEDYVNVPVGNVLEPSDSDFVVGDVILMHTPLISSEGKKGRWSSSNPSVVSVRPDGLAVASAPGKVTLSLDIGHHSVTYTDVVVGPITRVALQEDEAIPHLTNLPSQEEVRISVLLNGKGSSKGAAVSGLNFEAPPPPFSCHIGFKGGKSNVQASEWFAVSSGYDAQSGKYYCAVKRKDSKRMPQFLSTLNTNLELHVIVHRTSSQTEVRSPSVSIPFYPSFFVHQNEVLLSLQQREMELMVEGVEGVLRALQVTTNDSEIIAISKPFSSGSPNVLHFNIMLKELQSSQFTPSYLQSSVEVRCSLTGQSQVLPVKINLVPLVVTAKEEVIVVTGWSGVFQVIANNYQNWIFLLILILAIAGAVLLGYHLFLAPRYYDQGVNSGAFIRTPPPGAPPPYAMAPSPVYGSPGSPYSRSDGSFRRRTPHHSPTKLWSPTYRPLEGNGSPKY
ncbi:hypothetical protein HOLleu_20604 [Holothuria leucospilota]|uniref:BIG2 domain-containing protein n=1 Tax=Holothuria leucospilota TaxID=206669 RepID=A0A9Q1H8K6_HOLLE|nr:hypothetical protein HOLleu_20604 [Holothuria leucospilota]